ncbi:MAG TPA: metal ABC transporter permease [Spirochaetia bacterium]|nr:metal ABC transporter permease [Spirochaetia bacterium]
MLELLRYPFIVNALVTGSAVAVAAAASGYFMVCRRATFAGHALPNIGFAGAAGAVLLGIEPVYGLFAITVLAAVAIGLIGRDLRDRDVTVGVVMTFALGLGFLFLALYSGYAQRVYGILFGSILGISVQAARVTVAAAATSIAVLGILYRPLLFSTFDPELALARGVPVSLLSVLFLVVLAIISSLAVQVMGALLLFTLLVGPAATATRLVKTPLWAIMVSVALGLLYVWLGMAFAAVNGTIPVSFCIASLSFIVYLPVRLFVRSEGRRRRGNTTATGQLA